MSIKASFIERVACPDCGALAERIGRYYDSADGTIAFTPEPCHFTRDKNHARVGRSTPGSVTVTTGHRTVTSGGIAYSASTMAADGAKEIHTLSSQSAARVASPPRRALTAWAWTSAPEGRMTR